MDNVPFPLKICHVVENLTDPVVNFFLSEDYLEDLRRTGSSATFIVVEGCQGGASLLEALSLSSFKNIISFVPLRYTGPKISSLSSSEKSYRLLHWMQENGQAFDAVHIPFKNGLAYYTLLAKHQGWAFQNTFFSLWVDTSSRQEREAKHQWAERLEDLAIDFLEKECARLAELVFCSTACTLDWMKKEGWELPSKVHVFPFGPSKRKEDQTDTLSFYRIIRSEMDLRLHLKNRPSQDIEEDLPFVSVCMTHFNRPHCLSLALESIRAQDYPHFEVILVDDASDRQEAVLFLDSLKAEFSSKGWQIIRNPKNLFPGAARNLAAARSRGVYLLFMDDDNIAAPHEISSFVKAALKTGADILTCAMDVFEGPALPKETGDAGWVHRFVPLGAAASVGLYLNLFGDINALIKKRVYEELGGLSEDHGVGGEDWEFFGRAVLRGYHLETIPSALFWYRQTPGSITRATSLYANSMRAMRPYLEAVPKALSANLLLGQCQREKLERLLLDYQSPQKLLKRSFQLIWVRGIRAFRQPGKTARKIAKKLLPFCLFEGIKKY